MLLKKSLRLGLRRPSGDVRSMSGLRPESGRTADIS
jgi:hypothetical protein